MEYALMGLLLIVQKLMNFLLNLEVTDGVPLGGVIMATVIIGVFLHNFKISDGSSRSSGTSSGNVKSKGGD